MREITWEEFERVELRVGTILQVRSEFLLTGFYTAGGAAVLAVPERPVPNGAKLG